MFEKTMRGSASILVGAAVAMSVVFAADVIDQLKLDPRTAKQAIVAGIGNGYVDYGLAASAFKSAPAGLRAQLAGGAVAWAKTYAATPEFKAAYAAFRETRKPDAPAFDGTPEDELKRLMAEQTKGSDEMKQAMASMPPEQRKMMEEAMKQAAAAVAQANTPEMRKMQLEGIRAGRADKTQTYTDELKKWQEEYPQNAAPLIAKRLKAFLETSADVDFAAKLEQKGGKMRFVNDTYEEKPAEWKLCYRAGKEAVAAARTAAQAWLTELGAQ